MWQLHVPVWELMARSTLIYLVLLAALRLFGKREVGQFTLMDLVVILLVANAVQPAMTGPDTSLTGGLLIIATLVALNRLLGLARAHLPWVERLLQSPPRVLARNGKWIRAALAKEELSLEDCEMAIREHGIDDVSQVELAVLEADGMISVVPKEGSLRPQRQRPRVRIVRRI
ncbi:MAG TPA: YetF domain-containing protein [Candidatus Saccharimonadales bacterium]|nr:YetF domain-containing protein [Candidatus Saccharimonadales bacterium]